jgi:hypothetical protein
MVNGKIAGIAFGGLAGYLILNRLMSMVDGAVAHVCEASKWKSYYRFGKDGNMVPPGYDSHTHKIDDDTEMVIERPHKNGETAGSESDLVAKISDAINKAIREWKGEEEAAEGASEGLEKVSEEEFCAGPDEVTSHEELKDPMVADDLYDGIKIVDEDAEDDGNETLD